MGGAIGQQGAGRGSVLAMLGLVAAATAGYFFAIPGGSTGGMLFKEGTAAGTPASGERVVYAKTTGIYQKDSAGTESNLGGGTQNGTTGSTTNAIPKATAANTLGDSGLLNASGAILTPATGDAIQLGSGDYPKQTNIGGATSGYPALSSQAGVLLVVTGDGLGNWKGVKCDGLTLVSPDLSAGGLFLTNSNGTYFRNDKIFGFGPAGFASLTSGFDASVSGVVKVTDGSSGSGWIVNAAGRSYATADQTVDSTTLTADDTVTVTLKAGRKYSFEFTYYFIPGDTVADGFQINLAGGTATATGIIGNAEVIDNTGVLTAVTNSRLTALNTTTSVAVQPATSFEVRITGTIEVNAAGTFLPKFAKNADAGTGVTKKKYSAVLVEDFP